MTTNCTKRRYSKLDAKIMLMKLKGKRDSVGRKRAYNTKVEQRTYFCLICRWWHLTSKEKR